MSTESCLLKIGLDRFLELDGQNGQSSNFRHDHEIQPEKLGVRDCGAFGAMGFLDWIRRGGVFAGVGGVLDLGGRQNFWWA